MNNVKPLICAIALMVAHRTGVLQARDQFTLTVDGRIELLTVIQYLADWPSFFEPLRDPNYQTQYRKDIDAYFTPHKQHPTVNTVHEFMVRGFTFGTPVILMMHLSPAPDLELQSPLPAQVLQRAGGKTRIDQFIRALRAFYRDTDFKSFFENHRSDYDRITADTLGQIGDPGRYIAFLEDFSGIRGRSYCMVLSTVFPHNNYGFSVEDGGGTTVYNVTSPGFKYGSHASPLLEDGIPKYQKYAMEFILTHEFSHPFVNPLVDRYARELTSAVTLSDSAKETMKRNAYSTNWNPIEHMVRAITAVYFQKAYGDQIAQEELRNQRDNWGFEYIEEVYQLYQQYLKEKDLYPTFEAFFPVIVAHFTQAH